jgi:site-specific DNA-cytosine methylase
VCSGAGGMDLGFHRAGCRTVAMCEVDPWRRRLLAARFPGVPIYEDLVDLAAWATRAPDDVIAWCGGQPDVLIGGTPCQDISVAGKRAGLAGARSGLFFRFVELAEAIKPAYIVWENVAGLLSSNDGADFTAVLDGFESAGYVPEVNLLDAQHFGVPQRRRRVFVVCQHINHGRSMRTPSSLAMLSQAITEVLLMLLAALSRRFGTAPTVEAYPGQLAVAGLRRRTKFFDATSEMGWRRLLNDWIATLRSCRSTHTLSDSRSEREAHVAGTCATHSATETASSLGSTTEASLRKAWADLYLPLRSCITSTADAPITESTISTCALTLLNIVESTTPSAASSANCWTEDSCGLTATRELTKYARSSGQSLFEPLERVRIWRDIERRAESVERELERHSRGECPPEVLLEPASGRRDSAPRRGAWAGVADASDGRVVGTLARRDNVHNGQDDDGYVAHTLRAVGFDAGEDGTGRGTPLVPVGIPLDAGPDQRGRGAGDGSQVDGERSPDGLDGAPPDGYGVRAPDELAAGLDVAPVTADRCAYDPQPDGRRYAACGDGVVANVAEWIARRLLAVASAEFERAA